MVTNILHSEIAANTASRLGGTKEDVDKTMEAIKAAGETPYVVGEIEAGEKGVTLC